MRCLQGRRRFVPRKARRAAVSRGVHERAVAALGAAGPFQFAGGVLEAALGACGVVVLEAVELVGAIAAWQVAAVRGEAGEEEADDQHRDALDPEQEVEVGEGRGFHADGIAHTALHHRERDDAQDAAREREEPPDGPAEADAEVPDEDGICGEEEHDARGEGNAPRQYVGACVVMRGLACDAACGLWSGVSVTRGWQGLSGQP